MYDVQEESMDTIFGSGRIRRFPGLRGAGAVLAVVVILPLYAVQLMRYWREMGRQRRHLSKLDDRLLRDIGLTRLDVESESAKPFWRP
jgi:uncharacterized protein YjiS (DUF1127 family)